MADCNDLAAQIRALEEQERQLEALQLKAEAEVQLMAKAPTRKRIPVLKTMSGDAIGIDPSKWWGQVELDAIRMGDEAVKKMVTAGFTDQVTPRGSIGRMVNYSELAPTDENVAALMEVMGLRRVDTEKGVELLRPFTAQAAFQGLMQLSRETSGNPREVAAYLSRRFKGIENLPSNVFAVARARRESGQHYADVLEEVADAIQGNYLTDEIKAAAGNAARWAHYFENLDAVVRRKVGQGLQSLKNVDNDSVQLLDVPKDLMGLTLDDVTGGSLLAQTLDAVEKGDALQLKRIATAKRIAEFTKAPINRPNFLTQVEILNTYRRNSLLSSLASWGVRNPASGVAVALNYGAESIVEGSMRVGVLDGLRAAGHANKMMLQQFQTAWKNAADAFLYGKTRMGMKNAKEISPEQLAEAERFVNDSLNQSWQLMLSPRYHATAPLISTAVTGFNLLNAAFNKVLGEATKFVTGSDAGFLASFRLLNAGDEAVRTMAFHWKVNHEAYLRAAKEAQEQGMDSAWVQRRADDLTEKAVFSGVMTDDDLARFRRERNAGGLPIGDDVDDDTLRLQMFNELNGVPNVADELGRAGNQFTDEITFTTPLNNPVTQGIGLARQNPLVGWILPFWKVPINGVGWILNRSILYQLPKQIAMEVANQFGTKIDDAVMAQARARTLVSATVFATGYALWQSGALSDGGPWDRTENELWRRSNIPYALNFDAIIPGGKTRLNGIDFFDLISMQSDVARAFHDGYLTQGDVNAAMKGIVYAGAKLLENKAALEGLTTILGAMTDPDRTDWASALASQFTGTLPISGLAGNVTRSVSDPNERMGKRRQLSREEMIALEKDPLYQTVRPIMALLEDVAGKAYRNYGAPNPRAKDWLGQTIERPLGLPLDQAIPFMPVIVPQDPTFQWLEKHGFGTKPRPDAEVSEGGVKLTMTNEEEDVYREEMRTVVGSVPAEQIIGARGASINKYVQGNNLRDALRALSLDPAYNELLGLRISPSKEVQPGVPLSQRTNEPDEQRIYGLIDSVIKYYDQLGMMKMVRDVPSFRERWQAMQEANQQKLSDAAAQLQLGLQRQ